MGPYTSLFKGPHSGRCLIAPAKGVWPLRDDAPTPGPHPGSPNPAVHHQMSPGSFGSAFPRVDFTVDGGNTRPEWHPEGDHVRCKGLARAQSYGLECPHEYTRPLVMQDGVGVGKEGLGARSQLSPACCLTSVPRILNSHLATRSLEKPIFFTGGRQSVFCLTVSELDLYLLNI